MFIWWLIKRAAKPVVDFWNQGGPAACIVAVLSIVSTLCIDFVLWAIFDNDHEDGIIYFVATGIVIFFWLGVGTYFMVRHVIYLHTQYRAETETEKPKRKNDKYELIVHVNGKARKVDNRYLMSAMKEIVFDDSDIDIYFEEE